MTNQRAVLILDDNPAHRMLTRRALSNFKNDLEILEYESISDGESALADIHTRLVLALVDLNLGARSGLEFVADIRKLCSFESLPIIVLSTSALWSDIESSYRSGANSFIIKEDDPRIYQGNIKGALRFFLRKTGI